MKKKTGMYLAIGIIGIALALIAKFLLQDYFCLLYTSPSPRD